MKRCLVFLLFLLLPAVARAKTCDVAYYGIQSPSWPCEASIRGLDSCTQIRVAFLAHTFGRERACLARLLADRRVIAVEIHLINERCGERPGGCGFYEFMFGVNPQQFANALRARDLVMMARVGYFFTVLAGEIMPFMRPETVCWVSPVLETKLDLLAFQPLAEIAWHQFFGRCHIIYNPLKNTGHPWRFVYEVHGSKPRLDPPCITDLDGTDIRLDLEDNAAERRRAFYSQLISESQARTYVGSIPAPASSCSTRHPRVG